MNCIYTCNVVTTSSSLRSAVICFYLSNEGISLLENAAHLGLPVPENLKAVLSQLHNKDNCVHNHIYSMPSCTDCTIN